MTATTALQPQPRSARGRRGFTLFEVALALGLVAFGVVSTLMLFPAGLKAQQLARFKIYASAKALEMVDAYNTFHNQNPAVDFEAPNAWDVHSSYKSQAPDLESRVSSYRNGIMPLPMDIARRLDSDGDEIQTLLAQGGYLYYSQPLATTGLNETAVGTGAPPNEAQRLIIGIVGYAQNNALQTLPQKAWPYYLPYPAPPMHVQHVNADLGSAAADFWGGPDCYPWEEFDQVSGGDSDMKAVFLAYKDYMGGPNLAKATAYAQAAATYCVNKTIPVAWFDGSIKVNDFASTPDGTDHALLYQQVTGLRLFAHAANTAFKWIASGATSLPITVPGATVTLDEGHLRLIHDASLTLGMKFQAARPFDWGCPRPLQRALMMDAPLIEYDVGAPTLKGTIWGDGSPAEQWHPVASAQLVNLGSSAMFPTSGAFGGPTLGTGSSNGSGTLWATDQTHATLTAPFEAAERCRQIVFWVADWQSYEDFESVPSAPVDASKYVKGAPRTGKDLKSWAMSTPGFKDWQQYTYRNPEKVIAFTSSARSASAGNDWNGPTPHLDQGTGGAAVFSGLYGADRNANGRFDRGSVPASVRMRALPVARFNYYDLRVPAVIR
jgi:hypothetical protein